MSNGYVTPALTHRPVHVCAHARAQRALCNAYSMIQNIQMNGYKATKNPHKTVLFHHMSIGSSTYNDIYNAPVILHTVYGVLEYALYNKQ